MYLHGGRTKTATKAMDLAKQAIALGAGEILLTSMNNDGTKTGFALDLVETFSTGLPIPIIASGWAGTMEHFKDVFVQAKADAALAASIFHFKEIEINALKNYLKDLVPMRI